MSELSFEEAEAQRKHLCLYGEKCWCGTGEKVQPRGFPKNWPLRSDSAGINPDQIPAELEACKKRGIKIDFDPRTGEAIFPDAGNQRAYLKAYDMFDKDAFN